MYAVINERQRYDRYRSTKINEFHACFLEPRRDPKSRNKRRRRDNVSFRGPFTARRNRGASESSSRTCFSYLRSNWKTISTHRLIYARLYAAFGICVFNKFIREIATLPRRANRSACSRRVSSLLVHARTVPSVDKITLTNCSSLPLSFCFAPHFLPFLLTSRSLAAPLRSQKSHSAFLDLDKVLRVARTMLIVARNK